MRISSGYKFRSERILFDDGRSIHRRFTDRKGHNNLKNRTGDSGIGYCVEINLDEEWNVRPCTDDVNYAICVQIDYIHHIRRTANIRIY